MNLKFWKRKTGNAPQDAAEPDLSGASNPLTGMDGFVARMQSWLDTLKRHFDKPPEFRADAQHELGESGDADASAAAAPQGEPGEESSSTESARPKKWLAIAAASGLLLVALLVAVLMTYRTTPEPAEEAATAEVHEDAGDGAEKDAKEDGAAAQPEHEIAVQPESASASATESAATATPEQANTETHAEPPLQTPQLPAASPPYAEKTPPLAVGGEVTIGNENPKATAMTLKEAIEAMNAASGDYRKKPAK